MKFWAENWAFFAALAVITIVVLTGVWYWRETHPSHYVGYYLF